MREGARERLLGAKRERGEREEANMKGERGDTV